MKTDSLKTFGLSCRTGAIVLFTIAIFGLSCQKEMASPDSSRIPQVQAAAPARGSEPIAAIAINSGFTELVSALTYVDKELDAGLVNLFLNGKDQYTVFAPTNEAFEALYTKLNVSGIEELPASLVLNVLLYHVTEGRRAANSVVPKNGSRTIETLLAGATFSVSKNLEIRAVGNTANITWANISASNGIIHVIDQVILPVKL